MLDLATLRYGLAYCEEMEDYLAVLWPIAWRFKSNRGGGGLLHGSDCGGDALRDSFLLMGAALRVQAREPGKGRWLVLQAPLREPRHGVAVSEQHLPEAGSDPGRDLAD